MLIGAIGGLIVGLLVGYQVAVIRLMPKMRADGAALDKAERRLVAAGFAGLSVDRRRVGR